jgi:ATP phosphoribosyltransferase regulatory subunit
MQRERLTGAEQIAPMTPPGTVDVLLDDAVRKSAIESSFRELFASWGYGEVIPPIFERYENLLAGGIRPEWMYRFTDAGGEILALRPDLTTQVARIVATRLREQPKPLRLFYIGNVVRQPKSSMGGRAEFSQAGVELVGSGEPTADAEVVAIAIEALLRLDVDDFQVHVGQSAFFRGIVEETSMTEAEATGIRERLDRRDREALDRYLKELDLPDERARLVRACLDLCGGEEVLGRAGALVDSRTSKDAIANLAEVYLALVDYGLDDRVVIDLAEVRGLGYYTGMMVEGFSRSLSVPILEGGRYDNLVERFGDPCPAVGCALDLPRIGTILKARGATLPVTADVLVRYRAPLRSQAYALAATLRTDGRRVESEIAERDEDEAMAYARRRGIPELITVEADGARTVDVELEDPRRGES